jgi:Zn finger protein HypA/HybF involved in hydrogenase expression
MDIRDAEPIGTKCVRCHGQANVLMDGWTPDGPPEENTWTCPRCHAANTIVVPGKVVGVAIATGRIMMGKRPPSL